MSPLGISLRGYDTSVPSQIDPKPIHGNLLLASLPPHELGSVRSALRLMHHDIQERVCDAGEAFRHVHFPLSGVFSLLTVNSDGSVVEVATVGNEGMVGVPVFLGSGQASNVRVVCQVPGQTIALSASGFKDWLGVDGRLTEVFGAYVEVLLIEAAQSVACNRIHPVEERCARWLLRSHDRAGSDQFPMTHEFLSQMLGIRRASVTVAAGMLQKAGLIDYRRGNVTIVDRTGLEEASCECYGVVAEAQERLLPAPAGWDRRIDETD